MKHRWQPDPRFPDDLDLEVLLENGDWQILAFIRYDRHAKHYKCNFMGLEDNEFPDGETFKTKRGAMRFCERHLPVMWIRYNSKEST